jgi:hypothetical protein
VQVIDFGGAHPLPKPSSRRPIPKIDPGANGPSRAAAYWVGGAGLVGLAVGAVTGILAVQRKRTVDENCEAKGATTVCAPEGYAAIPEGKTFATVSTVATGLGALGVGLGAYFYFSPPGTGSGTASPARAALVGFSVERSW